MAGELWNRVHIPFPSVVSSVRLHLTPATVTHAQSVLKENEKVLKLINSELLQTEIRVLYELLHNLSNSSRGNKTFKSLKQVEQCINRLKSMKLDLALQGLAEVCSSKIQRELGHSSTEYEVPSQPMLEWTCLKVLGGAQLMSCTLGRCSRAFLQSKQQMKWEEFVLTNVVITSMLSRLWVIFQGVLRGLSALYSRLLDLLADVAQAKPMPFLTDFTFPADMVHLLGPSAACLIPQHPHPHVMESKVKKSPVTVEKRKTKDDLGVAIERDVLDDADMKPFFQIFKDLTEGDSIQEESPEVEKIQEFRTQVREAATFRLVARHLEEMIVWCRSQKRARERRLYSFLGLKCQKMSCLEAAGHNVQKKLRAFRREVCRASSSRRTCAKSFYSFAAMRRNARRRIQSLRSQFMSSKHRTVKKRKQPTRKHNKTDLSVPLFSTDNQKSTTAFNKPHQTLDSSGNDDIDDIFASIGL